MKIRIVVLNLTFFLFYFSIFSADFPYDINNINGKKNLIHFAILGSGPAGLSAAIPCARTGLSTVVFQGPKPGGQIADSLLVENWPGVQKGPGTKIMQNLKEHALSLGTHIEQDTINEVDFSIWPFRLLGNQEYYALSVIIATGSIPKNLCIEGEKDYWLKGIVSCGLCDAHLAKNQPVVIIGGGESAVERILQLVPYAKDITVITRNDTLCKTNKLSDKIKDIENVKIECNKEVIRFSGDDKRLTNLDIIDKITNEKATIYTNWAFVSIGFEPNSQIFKNYLKLDPEGHIMHNHETQETQISGIFTAGNVSDNRYKQAATASGDGTKAAFNAINFVRSIPFDKHFDQLIKSNLFAPTISLKNDLPSITNEKQLNKIISQNKLSVIDFFSPICSSCQALDSIIKHANELYSKKINFYKLDITKNTDIGNQYQITTLPTLIFFKNFKEVQRITSPSADTLKNEIEKIIKYNSDRK